MVKLLPKPDKLMEAVAALALNLYHTPYVVEEVAPPQLPVGAALRASCKFPVLQFTFVKSTAAEHVACAFNWPSTERKKNSALNNARTDTMDFIKRY